MEKAKQFLELPDEESDRVSRLAIHPHRLGFEFSFYQDFALRGIRVEPGFTILPGLKRLVVFHLVCFDTATMEKAKQFLELPDEESERVSRLAIHPHRLGVDCSFYEDFALRGIRVDRVEPGFVACTFKVPPRLTDRNGNFATGAVANLVDEVGGAVIYVEGLPMNVSVDMSISFMSTAKLNDELEITGRVLGQKGGYSGTIVLVRNKSTGEIIAEGRHSLFRKHASKL